MNDAEEVLKKKIQLIEKKEMTGLVWFGNDLRVLDNDVLAAAVEKHSKIIGVYFIDPKLFKENKLLAPSLVADFLKWLLLTVNVNEFSQNMWDIYDVKHHSYWRNKNEN